MKPTLFLVDADDQTPDSEYVYRTVCWNRGTHDFDTIIQRFVSGNAISLGVKQIVVVGGRSSISTAFGHIPVQNYNFVNTAGGHLFIQTSRSAPARGAVIDKMLTDAGNFVLGPVTHAVTAFEKAAQVAQRQQNTRAANYNNYGGGRGAVAVGGAAAPAPAAPAPVHNSRAGASVSENYKILMNGSYNPKIIAKKLTVYEEGLKEKTVVRIIPAAAGFGGIQLGPSASGAAISLRLRAHFGV